MFQQSCSNQKQNLFLPFVLTITWLEACNWFCGQFFYLNKIKYKIDIWIVKNVNNQYWEMHVQYEIPSFSTISWQKLLFMILGEKYFCGKIFYLILITFTPNCITFTPNLLHSHLIFRTYFYFLMCSCCTLALCTIQALEWKESSLWATSALTVSIVSASAIHIPFLWSLAPFQRNT